MRAVKIRIILAIKYRYANGDVYEGYFKDSRKHGHGVLKQGKLTARGPGPLACIYIGEWVNDKKNGYGVLDDINKGMYDVTSFELKRRNTIRSPKINPKLQSYVT